MAALSYTDTLDLLAGRITDGLEQSARLGKIPRIVRMQSEAGDPTMRILCIELAGIGEYHVMVERA